MHGKFYVLCHHSFTHIITSSKDVTNHFFTMVRISCCFLRISSRESMS